MQLSLSKRTLAEFLGTFWLVFGGCGSAVLAAAFPGLGIGFAGVALAFGLTVLTMAFAIGHISGCHLNPAVSLGLAVARRFPAKELPAYIAAQVVGGIAGAGVLLIIASGKAGFDLSGGFASNGYGAHSPGGYSLSACLTAELVLTFMFLAIILGATDKTGAARLRADRNRPRPHANPSHRDSGDKSIGQSRAEHRSRDIRRRMGHRSTVAVLDRAHHRSSSGRNRIPRARARTGASN
jgi:glycerol uptake facilitator-like aquaporin